MAMGRMPGERQEELFIVASAVGALDNPFYEALDRLLRRSGFDEFAEETCREFYAARMGRLGLPPGVYFRMLMVGYLEGIGSERGIAWLEQLARASGIETPTRQDLAKLDRKRPKKGSNRDWEHPHDPEARVTRMKDGRTRLAHKLEVGVDMESGAVAGVTVQTMDGGDTASLPVTLDETEGRLAEVGAEPKEVVADKGYHSNVTMTGVKEPPLLWKGPDR